MKKWRNLGVILAAILVLCAVFFITRNIYMNQRFGAFEQCLECDEDGNYNIYTDDKFLCGVARPEQLFSFRGNLYITQTRHFDVENDIGCDLMIFVNFPSGYDYEIDIDNGPSFYVSADGELLSDDADDLAFYEEHKDVIMREIQIAKDIFKL